MLIVFTGNGKGKTTASLGQAVRTIGRGRNVLMIQFIKGPWKSGEDFIEIKNRENSDVKFELKKMGLGFVGILGDQLPKEEHAKAARVAFDYFTEELKKDWGLIILDEINVAISLGLLDITPVLEVLKTVPEEKFILLTGRDAKPELIETADLVTEMKEIKHPFNNKKLAKVALDF